jgi:Flp pilus assembly protein TadD
VFRAAIALALAVSFASVAHAQDTDPAVAAEAARRLIRDGSLYFAQGDCALAQYFFQEALKRDADNPEALVGKGRALACQNAFSAPPRRSGRRSTAIRPTCRRTCTWRSPTRSSSCSIRPATAARLADALDVLQQAEQIARDDATVQNTKGIVLYQAGDLAAAQQALERSVDLAANAGLSDRERSTIHVNLGRTYRDLNQLELAQQAFRRAVVLDPTNASAHNNLGNVMYRLGDCDGAEFELSQAVALAPNSLSAVSQLAIVLFECGNVAGSIPYFERALQLDGAVFTPPLFTYLSRAYLQQGRLDDAVRRAQQGALLPPESAEAHYSPGPRVRGAAREHRHRERAARLRARPRARPGLRAGARGAHRPALIPTGR